MGPARKSDMDRYIALQTLNLLVSTFHNYNEREDENIQDDIMSSDNNGTDGGSEMSGIEKLPDDNGNNVHDNGFISTPDSPILNEHNGENSPFERLETPTPSLCAINVRNSPFERDGQINTEENILAEGLFAESVRNSPQPNRIQRLTSTGGIRRTPTHQTHRRKLKLAKQTFVQKVIRKLTMLKILERLRPNIEQLKRPRIL